MFASTSCATKIPSPAHVRRLNRLPALVGWRLTRRRRQNGEPLGRVMAAVIEASHAFLGPPVQLWQITDTQCGPLREASPADITE